MFGYVSRSGAFVYVAPKADPKALSHNRKSEDVDNRRKDKRSIKKNIYISRAHDLRKNVCRWLDVGIVRLCFTMCFGGSGAHLSKVSY